MADPVTETNVVLSDERLASLISTAVTQAVNAALATSNAAQSASGAGASTARTTSNAEGAQTTTFRSNEVDSDINSVESWAAGLSEGASRNRQHFDVLMANLNAHIANVNSMNLQALGNNQQHNGMNNTVAINRTWGETASKTA